MLVEYEYERIWGPLQCQAGLTRWQAKICSVTKRTTVLGLEWKRSTGGGRRCIIWYWINTPPLLKSELCCPLRLYFRFQIGMIWWHLWVLVVTAVDFYISGPSCPFKMIHVSTTGGSKHLDDLLNRAGETHFFQFLFTVQQNNLTHFPQM